jgi:hypothetical protein
VVLWNAQVQGQFSNPVLEAGVRSWSTTGTLTPMRLPSRQPAADECSAAVTSVPQTITLDDTNTTVVLFLGDDDLVYSGMAQTRFTWVKTVTCTSPNLPPTQVGTIDDAIEWLLIPQTPRTPGDVVIAGMGDSNGATRTWTLTKSEP